MKFVRDGERCWSQSSNCGTEMAVVSMHVRYKVGATDSGVFLL